MLQGLFPVLLIWLLLCPGNSGLVPTTLAEPTDSILSSPKQVPPEHFVVEQEVRLPTIVDEFLETSSEFVFEDEIDEEISKERFELSEEKRKIDMKCRFVHEKKTKMFHEKCFSV